MEFWEGSESERKEKVSKEQEKGGKGETEAYWTCGKAGYIAAWCRKACNNNLYATDEDDNENVEEAIDKEEDLQAWCLLMSSGRQDSQSSVTIE